MKHIIQEHAPDGARYRSIAVDVVESVDREGVVTGRWATIYVNGNPVIGSIPATSLLNVLEAEINRSSGESQ